MSSEGSHAGLVWHVTRCQGRELDMPWRWPDGCEQALLSTLLDDLRLPLQPSADETRVHLHRTPGALSGSVAVAHHCVELRCSVNGIQLAPRVMAWLQQGDVLDVGLYRLELRWELQGGDVVPSQGSEGAFNEPTKDTRQASAADVDLTLLAAGLRADGVSPLLSHLAAPDGVEDLLGRPDWSSADSGEPALGATGAVPLPEAVSDALAPEQAEHALLNHWHARYMLRLRSPDAVLDDVEGWAHLSPQDIADNADALEDLKARTDPTAELSSLLGHSTHIDTVLSQLDPHGPHDLFEHPEPQSVLHLFAPEGWTPAHQGGVLPSLTRLEHHGISLDSALSIRSETSGPVQPGEPA